MKKIFLLLLVGAMIAGTLVGCKKKVEVAGVWQPTNPIQFIVPGGAGGSTDQVTRYV